MIAVAGLGTTLIVMALIFFCIKLSKKYEKEKTLCELDYSTYKDYKGRFHYNCNEQ